MISGMFEAHVDTHAVYGHGVLVWCPGEWHVRRVGRLRLIRCGRNTVAFLPWLRHIRI